MVAAVGLLAAVTSESFAQRETLRQRRIDNRAAQYQNQAQGQPQLQQQGAQQQPGGPQAGAQLGDAQIAAFLNGGNKAEVILGRLAEQKAQSKDVKDMARQMVEQHTQLWQQLNQVAAAAGLGSQSLDATPDQATGPNQAGQFQGQPQQAGFQGQPPQAGQFQGQPQQPGQFAGQPGQPAMQGAQGLDFFAIDRQICKACLDSLTREFQDKQGADFDKGYVGWNIGAHMQMLDKIKVVRNYASPQLQQMLSTAEQQTRNHLEHFKKLMQQLESGANRSS